MLARQRQSTSPEHRTVWSGFFVADWMAALVGERTLHIIVGAMVVALLAVLGDRPGAYRQRTLPQRQESAARLHLFLPTLAIPLITTVGVLVLNTVPGLPQRLFGQGNHATLVMLFLMAVGCIAGWLMATKMTGEGPAPSVQEARRLLDAIG